MNPRRRWLIQGAGLLIAGRVLSGCTPSALAVERTHSAGAGVRFAQMRRFQQLRMGKVAYVDQGSGHAVLMLHGFPLNSFQWHEAIEQLTPHARCIAPDFLGMGHSTVAQGLDVGPEAQAEMLVALMDALGVASADLIANDSGCAVAQLLMVRHPARVRSVLLTNGDTGLQCPPPAMKQVIELSKRGRFVDEWLAPWHADPHLARSDQGIGGLCYADRAHPSDDALRMYFDAVVNSPERTSALHAYAVALERNVLAGIAPALRASSVPTRVVWGMADTIFDPGNPDYLERNLGNLHGVRRLPDAKLFWPEERPDLIAAQARILWQHAEAVG